MKILPAKKSVEFDINYNQELNCIDFNLYPNDWVDDAWLAEADCQKIVGEDNLMKHGYSHYSYSLDNYKGTYELRPSQLNFHKFTNTLKLSKTEHAPFDFMKVLARPAAAQLFNELKKLQRDLSKNQERANKLAKIVNDADGWDKDLYEGHWKIVKDKYSTSKWYNRPDVINQRSQYLYLVPASVGKEGKELVSIRSKYQSNPNFNFLSCDHRELKLRVADHDNGLYDEEYDISFDDFDALTEEGIIR